MRRSMVPFLMLAAMAPSMPSAVGFTFDPEAPPRPRPPMPLPVPRLTDEERRGTWKPKPPAGPPPDDRQRERLARGEAARLVNDRKRRGRR